MGLLIGFDVLLLFIFEVIFEEIFEKKGDIFYVICLKVFDENCICLCYVNFWV